MGEQVSGTAQSDIKILAALCSEDTSEQYMALQEIDASNTSWDHLLVLARQHQVSALLYRCIAGQQGGKPLLTVMQAASLRQTCRNIKMNNLRVEAELIRLSSLLDSNDIPHLVFKGPALARQVFGDLGLRQFNDYDLLIRYSDVSAVNVLMRDEGYQPIVPLNGIQRKKLQYFEKEITFIRPETGQHRYEADVHWLLLRPALKVPLQFDILWKQRKLVRLGSKECAVLNETYTLIACCIHNGGNEIWNTLKQVADLDAIIRTWGNEIDWDEVWHVAKNFDLEIMIGSALLLTHGVFKTPLSLELLQKANHFDRAKILADTWKEFSHPEQLRRWPGILQHIKMRRKLTTKARIITHSILEWLSPNFADEKFLPLAGARYLFPFYYLVRPFRILFAGKNAERF